MADKERKPIEAPAGPFVSAREEHNRAAEARAKAQAEPERPEKKDGE